MNNFTCTSCNSKDLCLDYEYKLNKIGMSVSKARLVCRNCLRYESIEGEQIIQRMDEIKKEFIQLARELAEVNGA